MEADRNKLALPGMIAAVAVIASGATIYFLRADKLTVAGLADAGFGDCRAAVLECNTKVDVAKASDALVKAKQSLKDASGYAVIRRPVAVCDSPKPNTIVSASPDGTFDDTNRVKTLPMDALDFGTCEVISCAQEPGLCEKLSDPSAFVVADSPCAYRPTNVDSKLCTRANGSTLPANLTMQKGQWKGSGCVRRSCQVMQPLAVKPKRK